MDPWVQSRHTRKELREGRSFKADEFASLWNRSLRETRRKIIATRRSFSPARPLKADFSLLSLDQRIEGTL